jgi:hypothetical protein
MFVIAEAADKTFEDIREHWAKNDIGKLASRLILQVKSAAEFVPDAAMTRAEFMTLLVRAMGLKENAEAVAFSDVTPGAWYDGWIGAAFAAGLANGYGDGSFRPDAAVSREEMSVMLVRALALAGLPQAEGDSGASVPSEEFVDRDAIAPWAKNAVSVLAELGILQGMGDGSLTPQERMTRAQAATVVVRMLRELAYL